jgi:hypothetical protein
MLSSPFKPRKHYVFNYKPRFYDERKERLEKLKRQAEAEQSSDYSIGFSKSELKDQWARAKSSSADRNTTIRLAVIIALLVGFFAWFFDIHTLI